ncbi:MAG: hypothetical protein IJF40_06960 [Clostridia bacterium]|nr:hypothetical protein [Clostridia bacterium]MBQ7047191.1 hypothetical protein [Oscillospiraceae bacterium]
MKIKRILSVFLCAVILFSIVPASVFAAARDVVDSGFCGAQGENLTWTLYDDGELVIGGEGEMDWYSVTTAQKKLPAWYKYYDRIDVITVKEGVTSIGRQAFYVGDKSAGKEPSKYYKINLPKSLEFYEGSIFWEIKGNRIPGQHLAYCYAGTENEWRQVKMKTCTLVYDENNKPVDRTLMSGAAFGNVPIGDFEELYYNGEEPKAFCELVEVDYEDIDIVTHYYSSDPEAKKIIWYAIANGKETKVGEIPTGEYIVEELAFPNIKSGELYMRAEIVDADGKAIVSSEKLLLLKLPTFMEKVKAFFAYANFTIFFITAFIILPAIVEPFMLPYYIYRYIKQRFF